MKNVIDENPVKFSLEVTIKSELEKRKLLELLPHNLSCSQTGLSKLIAEMRDGQTIYRSKERIRFIIKEDDKVKIECEEISYLLETCTFLNERDFEYKVYSHNTNLLEICSTINYDTLDEMIDDLTYEPRYVDKELLGINSEGKFNLVCMAIR